MFILRFNDYYQLLSNAAVKGATPTRGREGGRGHTPHHNNPILPLPAPHWLPHRSPKADSEQQPQSGRKEEAEAEADHRQTDTGNRVLSEGQGLRLDNFGSATATATATAVGVACNHRWCKVQVGEECTGENFLLNISWLKNKQK